MLVSIILLGGAIGGGYIWYKANPENTEKLQGVFSEASAVKDSIKEGNSVRGIMETYEENLNEVAKHGDTVNSASAALAGEGELVLEPSSTRASADRDENKQSKATEQATQNTTQKENLASPSNEAPKRRGF